MTGAFGRFRVLSQRRYRAHEKGTVFEAVYDPAIERAVRRGAIELLEWVTPALAEGSYRLPPDWPPSAADNQANPRRREAPLS